MLRRLANLFKATLLFALVPALQAQTTHLGVPPQQLVKLSYIATWDGTTFTSSWSDYTNGVSTTDNPKGFVVPAGKTLIITDIEVMITCLTAATTAPSIQLYGYINDLSATPVSTLTRFIPSRQTVGQEIQRTPLTGGYAVPAGYQIVVDPVTSAAVPTHYLRRMYLVGYYVTKP